MRTAVEALLRLAGGEAVLRVFPASDGPREEVVLKPVFLRVSGDAAEMLVSARAMHDAGGEPTEVTTARVVAGGRVWRVVRCEAVRVGGVDVVWRWGLVR